MGARHKKTHYRKMTPEKAAEIRILYFRQKVKQKAISETYGISQGNVSRILSEQVWA